VRLHWKSQRERERASRIASAVAGAEVAPRMGLAELAGLILGAAGVVAVDTGPAHLASALDRPQLVLYGPTGPGLTGVLGPRQGNLATQLACAPCLKRRCRLPEAMSGAPVCLEHLQPERVLQQLEQLL
jgi:heptosyltransferase-1